MSVYVPRNFSLLLVFLLALAAALPLTAQRNLRWHISPMLINVELGEEQPLQLFDAEGNELSSYSWSVDSPELAEIKEESGHAVLYPKGAGVVHVIAMHEGKAPTEEIKIWELAPRTHIAGPSLGHSIHRSRIGRLAGCAHF
jgi:hypothetical protein